MMNISDKDLYPIQDIKEHKYRIDKSGYGQFPKFFSEDECEFLNQNG
jgi:hypothetical protein